MDECKPLVSGASVPVSELAVEVGAWDLLSVLYGRGLHSFTSQPNLSRFGHSPCAPLFNRLGENHAPNVSNKMCSR